MTDISNFLQELGFQITPIKHEAFMAFYKNERGLSIHSNFSRSLIIMQAQLDFFRHDILDAYKIDSVQDLIFLLSRNQFFKETFPELHKQMINSPNQLT